MPTALAIDPALFDPAAIPAETLRFNEEIVRRLNAEPEGLTIQEVRARRQQGLGAFPLPPRSPRAETLTIDGPAGPISLRIVVPKSPRGIFFHIHGGGWSIGAPDLNDPLLESIADGANVACVSVKYRLAPEHPYPEGPDDCEAAALWVTREGVKRFGTAKLSIGGESAGGHLAAVTLLRMRDRHKTMPFSAAILNYGCYDLAMTPSVRRWGDEKLVLNTAGVTAFCRFFVPETVSRQNPDVSPLYADLRGMPPALFSVGTRDLLVDDSLFMAPRWLAAGNVAELAIYPGACHGFFSLPFRQRDEAVARACAFIKAHATES
jgi:acetyl esterase/lipase